MARIRLFADECVFGLTVRLLRDMGFDVIRAQDLKMTGVTDLEIIVFCKRS